MPQDHCTHQRHTHCQDQLPPQYFHRLRPNHRPFSPPNKLGKSLYSSNCNIPRRHKSHWNIAMTSYKHCHCRGEYPHQTPSDLLLKPVSHQFDHFFDRLLFDENPCRSSDHPENHQLADRSARLHKPSAPTTLLARKPKVETDYALVPNAYSNLQIRHRKQIYAVRVLTFRCSRSADIQAGCNCR